VQNLQDLAGNIAQLHVTTTPACTGQQTGERSHASAVDECHAAQVQNDIPAIRQERADVPA